MGFGFVVFGVVGLGVVCFGVVGFGVVGCDVVSDMQTAAPSDQVCSMFAPTTPHFPSHDPPMPQQVRPPPWLRPHLGHSEKQRTILCDILVTMTNFNANWGMNRI